MTESARPRVLLLGDPAARPEGIERALVRGGFQVTEADHVATARPSGALPDFILITGSSVDTPLLEELGRLSGKHWVGVPSMVLVSHGDAESATKVLGMGAADVMLGPLHLPEVIARVHARIRGRTDVVGMRESSEQQELLFDIFQEASGALRPDEIVQTLVRRVGEALNLARCSFVLTPAGEQMGRVMAVFENPTVRDIQVDLNRYPEILEAVRTEKPVFIPDVQEHPLFRGVRERWSEQQLQVNVRSVVALPVNLHGRTSGVFLLRTGANDAILSEQQLEFAGSLSKAAGRLLETEERRAGIYRRQMQAGATDPLTGCGSLDALDRRIREEFERARRYALSFSLILLDVDALRTVNERFGTTTGDRVLVELGTILQRELRAPDFVSRYGGDEFALILPETDLDGARRSVGRVRNKISTHPFPDLTPDDRPRISAGIVSFPHPSALQTEDLFALVEAALLRGKAQKEERIGTAESVAA
ncbi:MAG: diguanylate cyclase [Gemmatimonadota bacterium]